MVWEIGLPLRFAASLPDNPTDVELVDECKRGNLRAFERLYSLHSPKMKSLAFRLVGSRADAEDVVQDAFLKVYKAVQGFDGQSAISTWMFRILINCCYDLMRKQQRQAETPLLRDVAGDSKATLKIALERALSQLNERPRLVFLMFEVEGLRHSEIAAILQVPEGTSRSWLFEAKAGVKAAADGVTRMKFECGDLERALAVPELMAEAKEHLKECAACRREYRLWTDISSVAKELHEEWDSPNLWANIRQTLEAQPRPARPWWNDWKTWSLAATVVLGAVLFFRPWQFLDQGKPAGSDVMPVMTKDQAFLTEQALRDVEKNEAAYRDSIDRLSQLAKPKLDNPASAVAVSYHEKLLLIDSAISETRANLDQNRFNVGLQNNLADLYRQKQQTLQEILTSDQKN